MKLPAFFLLTLLSATAFAETAQVAANTPAKKPQHPVAPMLIGAVAISAMMYELGKEEPEALRDYFLLGSVAVAVAPGEASKLKPHLLPLTLGIAALNDHYERHPEKRDDEAGWANVGALWGGTALVALSFLLTEEKRGKAPASAVLPFLLKDGGGLAYSHAF